MKNLCGHFLSQKLKENVIETKKNLTQTLVTIYDCLYEDYSMIYIVQTKKRSEGVYDVACEMSTIVVVGSVI